MVVLPHFQHHPQFLKLNVTPSQIVLRPGRFLVPPPHGLPTGIMGRHDNELIYIYSEGCKRKLSDSNRQRLADNVYISLFCGLSLQQYAMVQGADCKSCHVQPCLECALPLLCANYVLQEGYCITFVPYPPPFFDHFQYAKTEGEGLGESRA